MSTRKIMEIVEEVPPSYSNKSNGNNNLYILCEGFKYKLREWKRWSHDELVIDDDYIITRGEYSIQFVSEVMTILENNGYGLKFSIDSIARRFMHYWLQLYNSNGGNILLPDTHHNGNDIEYEMWIEIFSQDFWKHITEQYIVYKGFDDTEVGRQLLNNISDFFWTYIDVNKSPTILKRREEDKKIQEEMRRWIEEPLDAVKVNTTKINKITSQDGTGEVNAVNNNEDH